MCYLAHKYLMVLWYFHEDHHQPKYANIFERNDIFFAIFAIPSMFLFLLEQRLVLTTCFYRTWNHGIWLCYFMIHDVLIHQRFKWFKSTKNRYLIGLRKAHKAHHKRWVRRVVRFLDAICSFKYYNM
jgi:beta-carotene 3-hydroxylase